jgi:hypothetical protein
MQLLSSRSNKSIYSNFTPLVYACLMLAYFSCCAEPDNLHDFY